MKRILITGSRDWTDEDAILIHLLDAWNILGNPSSKEVVVVHGAARGADTIAGQLAVVCEFGVESHPAEWKRLGPRAGPIRNQKMVDAGADICLAFPTASSRGTWDCVRRAEAAGIRVEVIRG